MNDADIRVAQLEQALADAKRDATAQTRGENLARLKTTRAELRKARSDYARLAKQIKLEDQARDAYTRSIQALQIAIGESLSRRPLVAQFLPDDEDVVVWRQRHDTLTTELNRQMELRAAVPTTPRIEAIQFEGPFGIIAQLERTELNLVNALSGSLGMLTEGGITSVF